MTDAVKTPLRVTAREFVLSMAVTLGGHLLGGDLSKYACSCAFSAGLSPLHPR
jgi:hypothetical protein